MRNKDKRLTGNQYDSLEIRGSTQPLNLDNQDLADQVREEFMDGPDDPGDNVPVKHPNRNTDKPSIDKPPYS